MRTFYLRQDIRARREATHRCLAHCLQRVKPISAQKDYALELAL